MAKRGFTSTLLHADRRSPIEHGSIHKPVHTSVMYGYEDSHELAAVFQGKQAGYTYGRQVNPTVSALEHKVTLMEGGRETAAFATGMAAIGSTFFSLLRAGDHVVASQFLFGNTHSLFNSFAQRGVEVSFVDATDSRAVEAALRDNTRLVFVETIANPRTQVADLKAIGELCTARQLLYVVDNTMTTPWLFQAKAVQAGLVINSLTKAIGGHANALGGAVTDTGLFDWSGYPNIDPAYRNGDAAAWGIRQIRKKGLRDFGATMGPDAAHRISCGIDTLALRMERACANGKALAEFLQGHPRVKQVYYPGLSHHPQHSLATSLFRAHGALLSIELADEVDCFELLNRLELVVSSSHLGDTRTLGIPVAHTIFYEMGAEKRAAQGIDESLLRLSIGIEDTADLLADFEQALQD